MKSCVFEFSTIEDCGLVFFLPKINITSVIQMFVAHRTQTWPQHSGCGRSKASKLQISMLVLRPEQRPMKTKSDKKEKDKDRQTAKLSLLAYGSGVRTSD